MGACTATCELSHVWQFAVSSLFALAGVTYYLLLIVRPHLIDAVEAIRSNPAADLIAALGFATWLTATVNLADRENKIWRIYNLYLLLRRENPIPKYTKFNVDSRIEAISAVGIFLFSLNQFYQIIQAPLTFGGTRAASLFGFQADIQFWTDCALQTGLAVSTLAAFQWAQFELIGRARRKFMSKLRVAEPDLTWWQRRARAAEVIEDRKTWYREKLSDIGLRRRELVDVPLTLYLVNFGPALFVSMLRAL